MGLVLSILRCAAPPCPCLVRARTRARSFILSSIDSTKDANSQLKFVYRLFPSFCLGDSLVRRHGLHGRPRLIRRRRAVLAQRAAVRGPLRQPAARGARALTRSAFG
jgi:hypothetical protein